MATEVSIFTLIDITPIMRFVVQLVRSRPPKQLTVVTKSSAQRHCLVVWDDIAAEVSQECPDVKWDSMPVDQLRQVRLTG